MFSIGLGPHGEPPFPADKLILTEAEKALARTARLSVAVVLHTMASDWSRQVLAGIVAALEACDATLLEVVDCEFQSVRQNEALRRLARAPVDAIVSLPVRSNEVRDGHLAVSRAGKKLILLDNAPPGLRPGVDYVSLCSADNFGLGVMAAELSSPHVPFEGVFGIITYAAEFFVTSEREIAFRKWMSLQRPDVTLVRGRFARVEEAGEAYRRLLSENDDLDGLFVAWDMPAMFVLEAMRAGGRLLPITTVDLGAGAFAELRQEGPLKGVAAQRPFDQGAAAASAVLLGAIGRSPPAWISSTGLKATRENLRDVYEAVWRTPAL